jgi:hypothetical protein
MRIFTVVGTRLRLEPCISSLITKSYVTKDIELQLEKKENNHDGTWYYLSDGEKKGWARFDFVKIMYEGD